MLAMRAGLAVAVGTPVVHVLAADSAPVYSDPAFWITPAGLVAALATGLLVPRPTYLRERDTADRLTKLFEDKMLDLAEKHATASHESATALQQSATALAAATAVQERLLQRMTEESRPPRRRSGT